MTSSPGDLDFTPDPHSLFEIKTEDPFEDEGLTASDAETKSFLPSYVHLEEPVKNRIEEEAVIKNESMEDGVVQGNDGVTASDFQMGENSLYDSTPSNEENSSSANVDAETNSFLPSYVHPEEPGRNQIEEEAVIKSESMDDGVVQGSGEVTSCDFQMGENSLYGSSPFQEENSLSASDPRVRKCSVVLYRMSMQEILELREQGNHSKNLHEDLIPMSEISLLYTDSCNHTEESSDPLRSPVSLSFSDIDSPVVRNFQNENSGPLQVPISGNSKGTLRNKGLSDVDTAFDEATATSIRPKRIRTEGYCFYCKEFVLGFGWHIARSHSSELEVQEILAQGAGTFKRRTLIACLRKKWNFLYYTSIGEANPTRKRALDKENRMLLPCEYCLGFYKGIHLWRHQKFCHAKKQTEGKESTRLIQGLPQNVMLKTHEICPMMKENVDAASDEATTTSIRRKRIKTKDYCFYCKKFVLAFGRHIARSHSSELEVQEVLAQDVGTLKRKTLIACLRKKGNFLYYTSIGEAKPTRKRASDKENSASLPCEYCLGFYRRKFLWQHRKTCHAKKQTEGEKSPRFIQGLAQNMMIKTHEIDPMMKDKVFSSMRADEISFTAKKDVLIVAWGQRLLKTHNKPHQFVSVSQKMRRLGRLLIQVKKIDPKIGSLIEALKPQHFDVLVEAVKAAAGYKGEADSYSSPTYAINIGTTLKQCCAVGNFMLRKKSHLFGSSAAAPKDLSAISKMIADNWRFEVFRPAANTSHSNKMNAIQIIPLAVDLKKMKNYLLDLASTAISELKNDPDNSSAYRGLLESVFCRVMLLCRKRTVELERLSLELYLESRKRQSYEEFADVMRPTEMVLIRKFKTVVIEGKMKDAPALFPFDVQEHIESLLELRNNFVNTTNPHLFSNMKSDKPIAGYQVLAKHAVQAKLTNPKSMVTRSLRKHLATMSQLLSMSSEDIEQVATLMGHTGLIPRQEYHLPDELHWIAKVSTILLKLERGEGDKYKGKTLDQIDIDLEENLLDQPNRDIDEDNDPDDAAGGEELVRRVLRKSADSTPAPPAEPPSPSSTNKILRPKRRVEKWSEEQKIKTQEFFSYNITNRVPPKQRECEKLVSSFPSVFKNRNWLKIKVYVQNVYTGKTKKLI